LILKTIRLDNIRSYKEAELQLPTGTILFQGDIRSGKSTILYAIEFALFGLGSFDGSFLLKNGNNQGSVTLTFEVNGKEYETHRALKRREKKGGDQSVSQTDCWLKLPDGAKLPLSASELKEEILKILNFNEPPSPRAQSVIYRYAVFTPQDEMKEIIRKNPDDRLQTLRKAFRIEDYKVVVNNASTISSAIKLRIAELNGQLKDLEKKRLELQQERDKLDEAKKSVQPLKSQEAKLLLEHSEKQQHLDKLQQSQGRIRELDNQIPEIQSQKKEKQKEDARLSKELNDLEERVKNDLFPAIEKARSKKRPTAKTKAQVKKEHASLEKQSREVQNKKGALEQQAKNFTQLIREGKCPICMRPLSRGDFDKNLRHVREEEELLGKKLEGLEKKIEEYNSLEEQVVEFEHAQKTLAQLGPSLEDAKARIDTITRQKLPEAREAIKRLGEKLEGLIKESKKLEIVTGEIDRLVKERDEIGSQLKDTRESLGSVKNQIQQAQANISKLGEEIQRLEGLLVVKGSLDEHRNWIGDYFSPTVETIERHVMIAIWEKMDEQFQRWFQVLIEDPNLQSKIDQDFSPIVTQNGYDQDFESLSGGEKTSVALAYRLALNSTVREISTGVKPNLLILDEPTDGFSKEQLFKIRDLIAELKCPQTIIVSHEEELDTCADHIFHVERVGGISTVSAVR